MLQVNRRYSQIDCQTSAAKFSGHQIQILLRWDSLAFMDYFRNLAIISDQQNTAIAFDPTTGATDFEMLNLF